MFVFLQVIAVSSYGCRIDVGCTDTLGLLHLRDMHFLSAALRSGAEFLQSSGPSAVSAAAAAAGAAAAAAAAAKLQSADGWIQHAGDVLRVGDTLSLFIKSIDREHRRMRLTTMPSPAAAKGDTPRKPLEAFWVLTALKNNTHTKGDTFAAAAAAVVVAVL